MVETLSVADLQPGTDLGTGGLAAAQQRPSPQPPRRTQQSAGHRAGTVGTLGGPTPEPFARGADQPSPARRPGAGQTSRLVNLNDVCRWRPA